MESARMLTTVRLLEQNLQVAGEPHMPGHQSSSAVVSEPATAGIWLRLRPTGCHLPKGRLGKALPWAGRREEPVLPALNNRVAHKLSVAVS